MTMIRLDSRLDFTREAVHPRGWAGRRRGSTRLVPVSRALVNLVNLVPKARGRIHRHPRVDIRHLDREDTHLHHKDKGAILHHPRAKDKGGIHPITRAQATLPLVKAKGKEEGGTHPLGLAKEDTHPLAKEDIHPLAKEATHPLAKEATHPLAKEATHPLAKEATHPLAKEATHHLAREDTHHHRGTLHQDQEDILQANPSLEGGRIPIMMEQRQDKGPEVGFGIYVIHRRNAYVSNTE